MRVFRINARDNIAIALENIEIGDVLNVFERDIICLNFIKSGHKIAISEIKSGDPIIKYGLEIGVATRDILVGEWVHTHNLVSTLNDSKREFDTTDSQINKISPNADLNQFQIPLVFDGYEREDGNVGIRNEIWIIPSVGCVNSIAQSVANKYQSNLPSNIDAVIALQHQFGCSQLGGDLEQLSNIIIGLVANPNACGVILLGLGCENNQISELFAKISPVYHSKLRYLVAQKTENETENCCDFVDELSSLAPKSRKSFALSKITIGLKCGGSDAYSGLSANPLIGQICEIITQIGGSAIVTEIPEMFGAEDFLFKNCANDQVSKKLKECLKNFQNYYVEQNQPIDKNPSPGNIEGGISTLAEKSLGAVQKCGNSVIRDIIDYGEVLKSSGLTILNAPGNDAISSTALAAAGANLVLFTTGRGTPFGTIVPTLKIASNSDLANNKSNWIDFDAGKLISEDCNPQQILRELLSKIICVLNGEKTKNELNNNRQIAFWKTGVTL